MVFYFSLQDEGLDHRDVDLKTQEPWELVRQAVLAIPDSDGRLVHLRHPSKEVTKANFED